MEIDFYVIPEKEFNVSDIAHQLNLLRFVFIDPNFCNSLEGGVIFVFAANEELAVESRKRLASGDLNGLSGIGFLELNKDRIRIQQNCIMETVARIENFMLPIIERYSCRFTSAEGDELSHYQDRPEDLFTI